MTSSARPESELAPISPQSVNDGRIRPVIYSDEALKAKNLVPTNTEWGGEFGRPIYRRLPAVSQTYQLDYPGQEDQAFVYINPASNWALGNNTLAVGAWEGNVSILTVESGVMTWRHGQADVEALAVNVKSLNSGSGLVDGDYQVGYILTLGVPTVDETTLEGYALYQVNEASLAEAAIVVQTTSYANEFPDYAFASSDLNLTWQPNEYAKAGPYFPGSDVIVDFRTDVTVEQFKLEATDADLATAAMATYSSDNGIVWNLSNEVRPVQGTWTSNVTTLNAERYWMLSFYDGYVNVGSVKYTGTALYAERRPNSPVTLTEPYIEDFYAEIDQAHVRLAKFTVLNGEISAVQDMRPVIYRKFEPVSDWLTIFEDENLKKLFGYVENYSRDFMAPPTAATVLYGELLDNYTFQIGNELDAPQLNLPTKIELREGVNTLNPFEVIYLKDPVLDEDMATKSETDRILNDTWTVDNGIY